MKPATITELKKELKYRSQEQLVDYCLAMARFKLESKELLTYLVFESENEVTYIESVKDYITNSFQEINTLNYHYIKKTVASVQRMDNPEFVSIFRPWNMIAISPSLGAA